ncbi:MAG: DUF1684 domain-containing protein [Bacteroidota bacterium]
MNQKPSFLLSLLMILWVPSMQAQLSFEGYQDSIESYHAKQIEKFLNEHASPLREQTKDFKGHDWFPTDTDFRVEARLTRTDEAKPFMMPTSNPDRCKPYISYGVASFSIDGKEYQLTVYKSLGLPPLPQYRDHYFIPFKDLTNGEETYGGGRYLDVRLEKGQETFTLDFNRCYNPYCAYSDGWSCPIPPRSNQLQVRIEAGIKVYQRKAH